MKKVPADISCNSYTIASARKRPPDGRPEPNNPAFSDYGHASSATNYAKTRPRDCCSRSPTSYAKRTGC